MGLFDDLINVLGDEFAGYDFFLAFLAFVLLVIILSALFNLFAYIFKWVGGIR